MTHSASAASAPVRTIIALGGSAGAIPALQTFFSKIPERTGISFVVILHLSPEHESSLAEILQRSSRIPVTQLKDNTHLLADRAYVIPPGKHVSMLDGVARLLPIPPERGGRSEVIDATNIPTVFLDNALRLKRYTPSAVSLFNLIHTDVGRPFAHVTHRLDFASMMEDLQKVQQHQATVERQVRSHEGRWYIARFTPYRTLSDEIAGVVLTFFDVTERKIAEDAFHATKNELETRVQVRTAELSDLNRMLREEIGEHTRTEKIRQELQRRIVDVQEQERGRISRELHDEIGQHVTALSLGLKEINDGKAAPGTAAKLLHLTQTLGREIHKIAVALRPTSLDDLGLAEALSHLVHEWSASNKIKADFHSTGLARGRLPPHLETAIYRIVGEALNNISKHAKAKVVSVVVEYRGMDVVAIVEDDGVGFDCDAPSSNQGGERLGLIGMEERAALLDGELTIESSVGHGTTIFARIPLAKSYGNS